MEAVLQNLTGLRILIAEDEFLLADDLARAFEDMGADVLGPTPTLEAAAAFLPMVQAALLDINLNGQQVFSIADDLAQRNIPFVFFTGYDDILIPDRFRHASKLRKPVSWRRLLMALFDDAPALTDPAATPGEVPSGAVPPEGARRAAPIDTSGGAAQRRSGIKPDHDIVSMLPMLRLAARLMLPDQTAADRLVKRTLQRAIIEADSKPQGIVLAGWLNDLMEQILAADGRKLMQ